MQPEILDAFQVLDVRATRKDVFQSCRDLFISSDEYTHALPHPFTSSEVDAVANAICEYIANPDAPVLREIVFTTSRPLEGGAIEYCEYASMFSEDMLYQTDSTQLMSLDGGNLLAALKTYLVGILFRYQFCVYEDRAAFPVSKLLDYMDGVRMLLQREQREAEWSDALWITLRALRSLEPAFRQSNRQ